MSRSNANARGVAPLVVVTAIVLLALTMRGPIVAVSAVVDDIRSDLGIGAATAGLLTSLPVLCFAVATPMVSWVIARLGLTRSVLASTGVLGLGMVVRSLDGLATALVGTVLIGIAITLANVAVPVLIGSELPDRRDTVLGVYTAALNVGSMITLSLTVPLADATSWRWALAGWVVLVGIAALVWWRTTRRFAPLPATATAAAGHHDQTPDVRPWWRRPVAWLLMIGFGGQAFGYYGVTAWLPLILRDQLGLSAVAAGPASSIFQVCAIVGALGVPLLLRRLASWWVVSAVAGCWAFMPLGLLLMPALWPVWCGLGGVGQGGGLTVVFALIVRAGRDADDSRRLSAAVQGGGYLLAATGPAALGALHELTGSWAVPLVAVLVSLLALAVGGLLAARLAAAPRAGRAGGAVEVRRERTRR
ncbi:MAG: MFS transporter [Propionibacteriaceae bacterium]